MDEVRLGDASVFLLPVVRGLPRERGTVLQAIDATRPGAIALSIAPEELEALRRYDGTPYAPDNLEEEVYVAGLSVWEEPIKPPPCFTEALRIASARKIRLEALDLDEDSYADAYTESVSALELIGQGRLEYRLSRKKFRAQTPEEFVLEWDGEVNRSAGFRKLQRLREVHMAQGLQGLAHEASPVLAVVELEREKGVLAALRG